MCSNYEFCDLHILGTEFPRNSGGWSYVHSWRSWPSTRPATTCRTLDSWSTWSSTDPKLLRPLPPLKLQITAIFKGHASDQRVCPVNDVSDAFVPRADTSLLTSRCWENVTFCYFTEVNVITVGERMKQCCIVWRVLCPFTSGAPGWPRCHPSL